MKAEAKRERTKMQFHVEFYETDEGKIPTVEFLDSLEDKMNAKMVGLMAPRAQIELAKKYRADYLRRHPVVTNKKKGSR